MLHHSEALQSSEAKFLVPIKAQKATKTNLNLTEEVMKWKRFSVYKICMYDIAKKGMNTGKNFE